MTDNPVSDQGPERTGLAMAAEPVTVIIAGPAVAKGRPRMTRRGFMYTPAATRKYEAHDRLAAQSAMNGRPPIAVPVRLVVLIELPVPASWSGRKRVAAITGDIRPTTRPDLDNYAKAATDALNGIVVADDSLIVELDARKRYGIAPKVVLTATPLSARPANGNAT
jgi:Holliday junction resolvase RusA-like endonuclease